MSLVRRAARRVSATAVNTAATVVERGFDRYLLHQRNQGALSPMGPWVLARLKLPGNQLAYSVEEAPRSRLIQFSHKGHCHGEKFLINLPWVIYYITMSPGPGYEYVVVNGIAAAPTDPALDCKSFHLPIPNTYGFHNQVNLLNVVSRREWLHSGLASTCTHGYTFRSGLGGITDPQPSEAEVIHQAVTAFWESKFNTDEIHFTGAPAYKAMAQRAGATLLAMNYPKVFSYWENLTPDQVAQLPWGKGVDLHRGRKAPKARLALRKFSSPVDFEPDYDLELEGD